MTEATKRFIREHAEDDLQTLLLNASRYRDVDVKEAVVQIKARKQIKVKLPKWYNDDRLVFPSTLAVEQCSSEITALYKQRLVKSEDWLCDLTGGLGIDAYFFSRKVKQVTFIEKNNACCMAASENLSMLGATNIQFINDDAINMLRSCDECMAGVNVFYVDPSRRSAGNRRLYAISDCEPDMMKIIALLPSRYRLIIKLSPMLDLAQLVSQIPSVCEVHVVSVKNECKELLLVVACNSKQLMRHSNQSDSVNEASSFATKMADDSSTIHTALNPMIHCVNYPSDGTEESFSFRFLDERNAKAPISDKVGRFLYEPNASILKAGAYKSVAWRYGVEKLHVSSHLYTSQEPVITFPGRIFEIKDVLPFNNRLCNTISSSIPQANISVRNFPLSVAELQKRTRISDGGNVFLYATTLSNNQKVLIRCSKKCTVGVSYQ